MRHIGIMQGRLVPPLQGRLQCFPRARWRDELPLAKEAGLDAIEWIYDRSAAEVNPLATDDGIAELRTLTERNQVAVRSICSDWFIDFPLVRATSAERRDRVAVLQWLLARAAALRANRIVVPFVDASRIETDADRAQVVAVLRDVMPAVEDTGVEIHLETTLAPAALAALLVEVTHPMVKVNYDSGNSASLGYDPADEVAAYGPRIGSVHIKDRVRDGGSVPLGTGDADLPALMRALKAVGYAGDFVLQVARGPDGDEVAWAKQNVARVRTLLADVGLP